jgi:putative PIN family toxin of toxin-antitoxin system
MLFAELQRVLQREKFRRYVSLRDAKAFVALLRRFATIHPDVNVESRLCSDSGDEYLIALAAAQNVDYLVSGDSHLTSIKNPPIPIVSPRTLADRLGLS